MLLVRHCSCRARTVIRVGSADVRGIVNVISVPIFAMFASFLVRFGLMLEPVLVSFPILFASA